MLKNIFSFELFGKNYFLNLLLQARIFPESWKIARVTPIPKKGDSSQITITDLLRSPPFSPK